MKSVPAFFACCVEALAALPGLEILLIGERPRSEAPYALDEVTPEGVKARFWSTPPQEDELLSEVEAFKPDVAVVVGWEVGPYRHVALKLKGRSLRVLFMDNQWLGTPKQFLGVATSRAYLRPFFDVAFLPGLNQAVFARKLGFKNSQIWWGGYSCDHPRFAAAADAADVKNRRRSFVFVGRLVPEKGVEVLAQAYRNYRRRTTSPWELEIYGTGPLAGLFANEEGVSVNGFVQPSSLATILAGGSCLVVPSLFEPWGVVVHEATAARLPVICTTACGAAPHLVEDAANGYVVEPDNVEMLARALLRMSDLGEQELAEMRRLSGLLAERYTPTRWARAFKSRATEALSDRGLGDKSSPSETISAQSD